MLSHSHISSGIYSTPRPAIATFLRCLRFLIDFGILFKLGLFVKINQRKLTGKEFSSHLESLQDFKATVSNHLISFNTPGKLSNHWLDKYKVSKSDISHKLSGRFFISPKEASSIDTLCSLAKSITSLGN